jgi:hypothetical protein
MLFLIIAVVVGCGIGLFLNGRSTGSMAKMVGGGIIVVLGLALFALAILVEAKKADVF